MVNDPSGTIYVVFRGTDSGLTDFTQANSPLGFGTFARTQLDDAIALTKAAIAANGGNTANIVVTGHSLGGGLAGLVSAALGLQSYLFDPRLSPTISLMWQPNSLGPTTGFQ